MSIDYAVDLNKVGGKKLRGTDIFTSTFGNITFNTLVKSLTSK